MDSLQNGSGARLKASKKEQTRSNRFGFRQANTVRPASVGPLPKHADLDGSDSAGTGGGVGGGRTQFNAFEENIVNNNNNNNTTANNTTTTTGGDNLKRRSKSASATTRNSVTFSDTVMVQPVKKTPQSSRKTSASGVSGIGGGGGHFEEQQGYRSELVNLFFKFNFLKI